MQRRSRQQENPSTHMRAGVYAVAVHSTQAPCPVPPCPVPGTGTRPRPPVPQCVPSTPPVQPPAGRPPVERAVTRPALLSSAGAAPPPPSARAAGLASCVLEPSDQRTHDAALWRSPRAERAPRLSRWRSRACMRWSWWRHRRPPSRRHRGRPAHQPRG
jgi:hypothetical protein